MKRKGRYFGYGAAEEAFRTLRSNLLLSLRWGEKVFMVTSARPREGKSLIASRLTNSYVTVTNRVLLADADFRRPDQHSIYGLQNKVGFTDVLKQSASLDEACVQVKSGVFVMTSGSFILDPQELLQGDRLRAVIDEMRSKFDIVIMDTAPVLVVADTVLMAPHTDGVLLVMRSGAVKDTEAAQARERLERGRAKIIGGILNCYEERWHRTDYQDYYYVKAYERELSQKSSMADRPSEGEKGRGQ